MAAVFERGNCSLLLRALIAAACLLFCCTLTSQPRADEKLVASIRKFVESQPDSRSIHGLGWDCLATVEIIKAGYIKEKTKLLQLASELLRLATKEKGGTKTVGWTNSETSRACVAAADSPCGGDTIVYGFQTGLALACLANAAAVGDSGRFSQPALEAIDYWLKIVNAGPCNGCIYFRASDSEEDRLRFIRNMNVYMAFGVASVGSFLKDKKLIERATSAMNSDMDDRWRGYIGYFGALDLQAGNKIEKERIENHLASMALVTNMLGRLLDRQEYKQYAITLWKDWATCSNVLCQSRPCTFWAADPKKCRSVVTAVNCAFRTSDPLAHQYCQLYLANIKLLNGYGILSVLSADGAQYIPQ